MSNIEQIVLDTKSALSELFEVSGIRAGELLVVGCMDAASCIAPRTDRSPA